MHPYTGLQHQHAAQAFSWHQQAVGEAGAQPGLHSLSQQQQPHEQRQQQQQVPGPANPQQQQQQEQQHHADSANFDPGQPAAQQAMTPCERLLKKREKAAAAAAAAKANQQYACAPQSSDPPGDAAAGGNSTEPLESVVGGHTDSCAVHDSNGASSAGCSNGLHASEKMNFNS